MNKNKKFDAVKMMRTIREEIQKEWNANPKLMEERLQKIREKLNIKDTVQTVNQL